jgi:hypothetical protein
MKNDRTDEFIVGFDREDRPRIRGRRQLHLAAVFEPHVRRYARSPAGGLRRGAVHAGRKHVPSGQERPVPDRHLLSAAVPAADDSAADVFGADLYNRTFNGFELTARKRMSHHWLMNTSFSYNSTVVNNGFAGAYQNTIGEDPTNLSTRNGFQYDYASAGSGLGNIYVNSKYLFKISGLYQLPLAVNVSAFYNARQGYPFEASVNSPSRLNGAGIATILLDGVGDNRLPTYQNIDFHVERPIKIGTVRFIPSLDLFNVGNANTILALQRQQNSGIANDISQILAPRVARVGVRVNW